MNREIKFRAWGKTHINKEPVMDYSPLVLDNECYGQWSQVRLNESINNGGAADYDAGECKRVFMQYTGLKDKNGREIYEGDIIRAELDDANVGHVSVEWDDAQFTTRVGRLNAMINIHVIGNIYENPELLG